MNIHQVGLGFKRNRWSFSELGLAPPSCGAESFGAISGSQGTVRAPGGLIFIILMTEEYDFYYAGKCKMYLG